MAQQSQKQDIEQLTARYQKLHTQKIEAETNLKNSQKQLEELKKQAKKEFGTDDVDQLKTKLVQMDEENERQRGQYQSALDKIENDLEQVQEKYQQAQEEVEA